MTPYSDSETDKSRLEKENWDYFEQNQELKESKDQAYWERDQLVCLLSKLYPSHLTKHPATDLTWEKDWMNIVCIHFPTGQGSWHIHDTELEYFKHLQYQDNHWDGHSTEEKYNRIRLIEGKKNDQ